MRPNTVKQKWQRGEVTYGAWLSIPDAFAAETMARAGFDWACIDMQHGVIDYAACVDMLSAMRATDATPFVRVPWNEPGIIGKVLDAGACGVIIPMVNTPAEAEAAVAACRYAPDGRRSYGPNRALLDAADYFERANAEILCIPIIETAAAVAALDEILDVPGIDAVYVGPADLSITLGLPPRMDNGGAFLDARDRIASACSRRGIVAGIHGNAQLAAGNLRAGYRMLTVASDISGMARAASEDLQAASGASHSPRPSYS